MLQLPAVCRTCGTAFPSGFTIEGSVRFTAVGNLSGPCPRCGGMGAIPDGDYEILGDALVAIRALTPAEVHRFASVLTEAREKRLSVDDVRQALAGAPDVVHRLVDLMPLTKQDWYAVIEIVLAFLALLIALSDRDTSGDRLPDRPPVVQEPPVTTTAPPAVVTTSPAAPKATRPGRNSPCPCGSGRKYKQCCLDR